MAFHSEFDDCGEIINEINMTPFVDVMLVLLIIFMLTMPVLTQAVKIALPQASTQPDPVKPRTIAITVAQDGKVYWDNQPVDTHKLEERLSAAAQTTPQPEVRIRGDRQVQYEFIMDVMASVQHAGIHKLGFVTEPNPPRDG
jgi:biopolymer transport protein ExbD